MNYHLNVNEVFGPTIQGEGIHAGRLVSFVRLAGCNLACSWCDTPYSWDWERFDKREESHAWTVEELAQAIDNFAVERVIITGGEPLLQQRGIKALANLVPHLKFEIETNGTVLPNQSLADAINLFVVSPKLAHSGDNEETRIKHAPMQAFAAMAWMGQATFKFVAQSESDLASISELSHRFHIPHESIWVMPEGIDAETHLNNLQAIADAVIARGWNLTTRLHVLAWGNRRKV